MAIYTVCGDRWNQTKVEIGLMSRGGGVWSNRHTNIGITFNSAQVRSVSSCCKSIAQVGIWLKVSTTLIQGFIVMLP